MKYIVKWKFYNSDYIYTEYLDRKDVNRFLEWHEQHEDNELISITPSNED